MEELNKYKYYCTMSDGEVIKFDDRCNGIEIQDRFVIFKEFADENNWIPLAVIPMDKIRIIDNVEA